MGDIVKSRELDDEIRERATREGQAAFDRINNEYIGSLMAPFGMVRGDAFEGVILVQSYAPMIVQDIIKAFYRADKTIVRISVVLGQLTVTSEDRNITDGPAFHKALDNLSIIKERKSTHWLQVSFEVGELAQALVDGHIALLESLTEGWTDRQRQIVWTVEANGGRQHIAARDLGIKAPVVAKQLKAAHYEAYCKAWDGLTEYLVKMDEYTIKGKPAIEESYVPYFNVAWRIYNQANDENALTPAEKSLYLAKKELSNDDPRLIPIYNLLTKIYTALNKHDKAKENIEESIRIQEPLPKARLDYAETMYTKATLCLSEKKYQESQLYYSEALRIACDVVDDGHPIVGKLNGGLATVYGELGDYENAKILFEKALVNAEANREPIKYAIRMGNIARCYYRLSKFLDAILYAEKTLQLFKENLSPKHHYISRAQEELRLYKEAE
jgi:tetratricopeptide (TPR) repeat protein